jgi:hypothetical protein
VHYQIKNIEGVMKKKKLVLIAVGVIVIVRVVKKIMSLGKRGCPQCDGSGKAYTEDYHDDRSVDVVEHKCPTCKG